MVITLEVFPIIFLYILIGTAVHTFWGFYKVYTNYLYFKIKWTRILVEVISGLLFGTLGAFTISSLLPFQVGAELGGMLSAILGANFMSIIQKRFGISKFEAPVLSDQQLKNPDLKPRQTNALEYVRSKGKITNTVYQRINETTRSVAKRELHDLVNKGRLARRDSFKRSYYTTPR